MKLKTRIVNIIEIDDFDNLVIETYKRLYSFQQQDGCKGRGTVYFSVPFDEDDDFQNHSITEEVNGEEMGVSFKAWLERDPLQKLNNDDSDWHLDLFWGRNFYPEFQTLVNDLYSKGYIDAGEYGINIDW